MARAERYAQNAKKRHEDNDERERQRDAHDPYEDLGHALVVVRIAKCGIVPKAQQPKTDAHRNADTVAFLTEIGP